MVIKNNTNPTGADHATKKPKQIFVYGNYKAYYGYRIGQNGSEDPRLSMFKKEWFEGKDCLDIGCNQGIVTIDVVNKFSCRSILGRDIDGYNAYWNLRKIAKQELLSTERDDKSEHHLSNFTDGSSKEGAKKLKSEPSLQVEPNLLNRVSFRKENIVANTQRPSPKYDTILCLSDEVDTPQLG